MAKKTSLTDEDLKTILKPGQSLIDFWNEIMKEGIEVRERLVVKGENDGYSNNNTNLVSAGLGWGYSRSGDC